MSSFVDFWFWFQKMAHPPPPFYTTFFFFFRFCSDFGDIGFRCLKNCDQSYLISVLEADISAQKRRYENHAVESPSLEQLISTIKNYVLQYKWPKIGQYTLYHWSIECILAYHWSFVLHDVILMGTISCFIIITKILNIFRYIITL